MTKHDALSRRRFLGSVVCATGAGLTAPYFVQASSLGLGGATPPSDRIVMASIGSGGKGRHNTGEFLKIANVQFVAVCDVDQDHALQDKQQIPAEHLRDLPDGHLHALRRRAERQHRAGPTDRPQHP